MKHQWKKLAVALGAAILVVCQNEVLQVNAEEITVMEDAAGAENAANTDAAANTESATGTEGTTGTDNAGSADNVSGDVKAVDTLQWIDGRSGYATVTFQIPNEKGSASYKVEIKEPKGNSQWITLNETDDYSDREKGTVIELDVSRFLTVIGGTYNVRVTTFNANAETVGEAATASGFYRPIDYWPVTFLNDPYGHISFELRDKKGMVTYKVYITNNETKEIVAILNPNDDYSGQEQGTIIELDVSQYMMGGYSFCIHTYACYDSFASGGGMICPLSPSRWSTPSSDSGSDPAQNTTTETNQENDSNPTPVNETVGAVEAAKVTVWQPTTPDEQKRYAVYGREKVEFTADTKGAYDVVIQNAMQGTLCFDSFESVLEDRIIARTYNILPSGGFSYKMDQKARISLQIPATIQADGRTFQMICVTENGVPVILKDLDQDPATITFETDTYYAFALVYKDASSK